MLLPMEPLHRFLPLRQLVEVEEGVAQPSLQQPPAHGRPGQVDDRKQRTGHRPLPAALEELQVAPRLGVQQHVPLGGVGAQPGQQAQRALLVLLQVAHDGAGGPDGERQVGAAVALQGGRTEVVQQALPGRLQVRPELVDPGQRREAFQVGQVQVAGDQDLRGMQALQLRHQVLQRDLGGGELRGGDVDIGQPGPVAVGDHADQVVVGGGFQQPGLDDGAGGDHPHHVPLHQALSREA